MVSPSVKGGSLGGCCLSILLAEHSESLKENKEKLFERSQVRSVWVLVLESPRRDPVNSLNRYVLYSTSCVSGLGLSFPLTEQLSVGLS